MRPNEAREEAARALLEEARAAYVDAFGGPPPIELDGLHVSAYRESESGRLVVLVESHDLDERDTWPDTAVPRFALVVNDSREETGPDGAWLPPCAVCEREPGTIEAERDGAPVRVCAPCYGYETGEEPTP